MCDKRPAKLVSIRATLLPRSSVPTAWLACFAHFTLTVLLQVHWLLALFFRCGAIFPAVVGLRLRMSVRFRIVWRGHSLCKVFAMTGEYWNMHSSSIYSSFLVFLKSAFYITYLASFGLFDVSRFATIVLVQLRTSRRTSHLDRKSVV